MSVQKFVPKIWSRTVDCLMTILLTLEAIECVEPFVEFKRGWGHGLCGANQFHVTCDIVLDDVHTQSVKECSPSRPTSLLLYLSFLLGELDYMNVYIRGLCSQGTRARISQH